MSTIYRPNHSLRGTKMAKLSRATLDDLSNSTLDNKSIKAMQIRDVCADELYEIFKAAYLRLDIVPDKKALPHVDAYEIPYFSVDGNLNGFCRYKLLEEFRLPKSKKPSKYLQLIGTKPQFYLPPLINWSAIASNPKQEVYITEGEKKAAALTLLGFPTIGVGGVSSWKASEDDFSDPIADFNLFDWNNRKTILVFDADV